MISQIVKVLGVSKNSYWNYKKQGRPIIDLLERYFGKEELQEFLDTGKISKLEKSKVCDELLAHYKSAYFNYIQKKMSSITSLQNHLEQYYFQYLYYLKDRTEQFGIHKRPFHAAAISFAIKYENDFDQREIDNFHLVLDIIDFLDDEPGMWNYFKYLLKNDLQDFIEGMDLQAYWRDDKIVDVFFEHKKKLRDEDPDQYSQEEYDKLVKESEEHNPLVVQGLDHYYLYHCYNNIAPYSINELQEDMEEDV